MCSIVFNANAYELKDERNSNEYNPHSYGSPELYYSTESMRERKTQALIKQSNDIAKERLEIERKRLRDERREYGDYSED